MTQEACGENLPSLERARNFKTSKRSKDEVRKQKKFQVFNPRQRRSFGKNRIYCPLQGHSTTDYVLSESTGSVFSTGFVRDNIGTEGRGGTVQRKRQPQSGVCPGPTWFSRCPTLYGGGQVSESGSVEGLSWGSSQPRHPLAGFSLQTGDANFPLLNWIPPQIRQIYLGNEDRQKYCELLPNVPWEFCSNPLLLCHLKLLGCMGRTLILTSF